MCDGRLVNKDRKVFGSTAATGIVIQLAITPESDRWLHRLRLGRMRQHLQVHVGRGVNNRSTFVEDLLEAAKDDRTE